MSNQDVDNFTSVEKLDVLTKLGTIKRAGSRYKIATSIFKSKEGVKIEWQDFDQWYDENHFVYFDGIYMTIKDHKKILKPSDTASVNMVGGLKRLAS